MRQIMVNLYHMSARSTDTTQTLSCSRCLRSFIWDTYKRHLYRGCKEIASDVTPEDVRNTREYNDTMDISVYLEADDTELSKS